MPDDPSTYFTPLRMKRPFSPGAADVLAPTLSNPNNGTETSDGTTGPSVDTNEAGGTLYWAVLTNGGAATDAQIKAGAGGDIVAGKAGNQVVSGTGTQVTSNITGLSAATDYEIVWLHRDAAGNDSAQATIGLTTAAAGSTPSRTGTATADANLGDGSTSVTVPANTNYVTATWVGFNGASTDRLTTLTLGGQSLAELVAGLNCDGSLLSGVSLRGGANSGTGSQTLAWTYGTDHAWGEGGRIYLQFWQSANLGDPVRAAAVDRDSDTNPVLAALASTDPTDRVFGMALSFTPTNPNVTVVTEFLDNDAFNSHIVDLGDATGLSGTVNIENSSLDFSAVAAVSLKSS